MTLRDTKLIAKKLIKYGFVRYIDKNNNSDQLYQYWGTVGAIYLEFKDYGGVWVAVITHKIDFRTEIKIDGIQAVFTPEYLVEQHNKLQAMLKFMRL